MMGMITQTGLLRFLEINALWQTEYIAKETGRWLGKAHRVTNADETYLVNELQHADLFAMIEGASSWAMGKLFLALRQVTKSPLGGKH
jgi:hypothetical protein